MATLSVVAGPEARNAQHAASGENVFRVGTRKSKLALNQTDMVIEEALKSFPQYTFAIKARDTAAGDIDKVTPFKDMPVKNIWTHELETLMIEKNLDTLVHALKGKDQLVLHGMQACIDKSRRADSIATKL